MLVEYRQSCSEMEQERKSLKKRRNFPLWKKYEIVSRFNSGKVKNVSQLAKEYEIPRSSLQTILSNKDKVISEFEAGRNAEMKKKRKHNFDNVDEPLLKWFRCARDKKIPVSGEMLLLKAQEYGRVCGYENSEKLDINWVNRWKARVGVVCKKLHGEAESVDQDGVNEWQNRQLPALLKEFLPEQIFNTDETGLFYRCLPDKTHVFKNEKCAGGKLSKERLTVLVTASMTGEKLPPLVIGKSANPRCFKNVRNLPLPYEANSKAWMTSTLFEKWLRKIDFQMKQNDRKIALILDNCTAHPNVSGLTNIKLVFLPPNTTAKTQPMDAGVIRCLKAHYRKRLANLRLLAFEEKKDFKVDVLQAMRLLREAWNSVSQVTIQNCFKKAKFVRLEEDDDVEEIESLTNSDIEGIWERLQASGLIPETYSFTDYSESDANVVFREAVTENDILNDLQTETAAEPESIQEGDDDSGDHAETLLSPVAALTSMRQLDRYLRSHDDSDEMLRCLAKIEHYVITKSTSKPKQLKITDMFAKK